MSAAKSWLPIPQCVLQRRNPVSVQLCSFSPRRLSSICAPNTCCSSVCSGRNSHTVRSIFPHVRLPLERAAVSLATRGQERKPPEIEVEETNDRYRKSLEFEESWNNTLAFFKEQAIKLQSVSQEAYVEYSGKAAIVLEETSSQMRILADKAGHDLSLLAKEVTEDGKEYLNAAAEISPETVKDVVETFTSSANDLNEISKVYDFYLGIPYGLVLSLGGFLAFMLTGSISAIRFGVILGGALLALSVSSLKSWKNGESFDLALKGQIAISAIIFLRELRLMFKGPSFFACFTTLISGAMVAFYAYRIILARERPEKFNQHDRWDK